MQYNYIPYTCQQNERVGFIVDKYVENDHSFCVVAAPKLTVLFNMKTLQACISQDEINLIPSLNKANAGAFQHSGIKIFCNDTVRKILEDYLFFVPSF
jgi:hypothetical protein